MIMDFYLDINSALSQKHVKRMIKNIVKIKGLDCYGH